MTLQQNLPLYSFLIFTTLFFLVLIAFLFVFTAKISIIFFLFIVALCAVLFIVVQKIKRNIFSEVHGEFDELEEKANLLAESINERKAKLSNLPLKRQRVFSLFNISQNLIESVKPLDIFDSLMQATGDLFPQAENILLFDFDKEKYSLNLRRSSKQKGSVIKTRRGDALDKWVLHHNRSLLVEDLTNDFRFDYNKVQAYKDRGVCSFILSPLSIGDNLLGIVRAENKGLLRFSLDDSRLLRNICDLGAVVLERANLFEHTKQLATKDSLTSLFLKGHFLKTMAAELAKAKEDKKKIGLIMLDIDDFKKINDTYGHIVGDRVLIRLSKILTKAAPRGCSIVSRFGGEEFIVAVLECKKNNLLNIAQDIRKSAESSGLTFRRKKINFTVSLGASLCPDDGENIQELIDKADKLLYEAKRKGKNRLCYTKQ